jgi:hypothetical protein
MIPIRLIATHYMPHSPLRSVVLHEAAAPSRRKSQADAAGENDELKEDGVHVA